MVHVFHQFYVNQYSDQSVIQGDKNRFVVQERGIDRGTGKNRLIRCGGTSSPRRQLIFRYENKSIRSIGRTQFVVREAGIDS